SGLCPPRGTAPTTGRPPPTPCGRVSAAMDLTLPQLALVLVAALGAGAVNALAGGGTLLVFPALTAVGVPTVNASITTTIALNAGYLGGSAAQRDDLAGQRARLTVLGPAAVLGGITGAYLLSV